MTLKAYEAKPSLRKLVPYLRRFLAVDTNVPSLPYSIMGNGRAAGVAPTMELEKWMGWGKAKFPLPPTGLCVPSTS